MSSWSYSTLSQSSQLFSQVRLGREPGVISIQPYILKFCLVDIVE